MRIATEYHWSEPDDFVQLNRPAWQNLALCHNQTELFFPEKVTVEQAAKAKLVCAQCPVQTDCLDMAYRNDERDGIWGGLTPLERDLQLYGYNRNRGRRPQ